MSSLSLSDWSSKSEGSALLNGLFSSMPFFPAEIDDQEAVIKNKSLKKKKILEPVLRQNKDYYTIGGRFESRPFSLLFYQFSLKAKENYNIFRLISVPPLDPAVPKPEGGISIPACGEPLLVPASFPQSIEAAIHKFANASSKATCISVIDQNGKPITSLTYGIFFTRNNTKLV